ncbi:MAG: hypothetical protein KBA66_00445 [Leptospiraceae bacterium]|nr:hypothetical protein [Leptospiraceae bacterium]
MNSNKKLAIASLGSDENAKKTSEEKADTGIRVSNIISMNEVTIFLGDDHIKEVIKSNYNRLRHLFDRYNIIIKDKQDERIRLMKSFDQPIVILNRENPDATPAMSVPYNEYHRMLKADKNAEFFKSEICVPIKYRQYIIIGYVQVMHSKRLDLNSFNVVALAASSIRKEISDYKNYEESTEVCRVTSITETDVTFLHSLNKHFSRIFQMGAVVILDLYSKDTKITIKASIKGLKPLDKHFSVTCQFVNMSIDQYEKIEKLVMPSSG